MTSTEQHDEALFDDVDDNDDELLLLATDHAEQETSSKPSSQTVELSEAQKQRAEKNRLKALSLKKARLASRPYPETKKFVDPLDEGNAKKPGQHEIKLVDTNAGFFIEEDVNEPGGHVEFEVEREPAPVLEPDRPTCLECRDELADSFLFRTFDLEVCDKCRDTEKDGKHELVTLTQHEYMLTL